MTDKEPGHKNADHLTGTLVDQDYMGQALSLAAKGKGFTSPNPCVGAVVVKDGRIIGQGYHKGPGLAHAEVNAIDDAVEHNQDTRGATIYVTLEPCNHFGKTPPCTHKILDAGITRVVVGCKDPNPHVSGGGIKFLQKKGIRVEWGILGRESALLIEDFLWYSQNNKTPFVILKTAATLDGRIATATGDSKWITNEGSRSFVHLVRHETDAILIGSGTLAKDDPSLTARIPGQKTKDPVRIVLDSNLSISHTARIITGESNSRTIVATGPCACRQKAKRLRDMGVVLIELNQKEGLLDLEQLMIKLGEMSILSVLIEGGGRVAASALAAGIVNKVMYFVAPKLMGGSDGVPVFNGKGPEKIKDVFELDRVDFKRFGSDMLVSGYLKG